MSSAWSTKRTRSTHLLGRRPLRNRTDQYWPFAEDTHMITVYSCMHLDIETIPVAVHKAANTKTFYTFKIALKMLCILGRAECFTHEHTSWTLAGERTLCRWRMWGWRRWVDLSNHHRKNTRHRQGLNASDLKRFLTVHKRESEKLSGSVHLGPGSVLISMLSLASESRAEKSRKHREIDKFLSFKPNLMI